MSQIISPLKIYKFCPKCSSDLNHLGGNLLKCVKCDHDFFINQAPTAGGVICNDKNQVLLVKRKNNPNKGTWQIPGGFMNLNEDYEQALMREMEEELSVKVAVGEFIGTFTEEYFYSGIHMPILCIFSATQIISGEIVPCDDAEEARFFNIEELAEIDFNHDRQRQILKDFIEKRTA